MKKIITILLALAMAVTMSVSIFAETMDVGTKDIEVKAKYTNSMVAPKVVSVDVTWGKMEFTYTVGGTADWDPTTHDYVANTSAQWTAEGNEITVTNHSNIGIQAGFAFTADKNQKGLTGSFSSETLTLPTAAGRSNIHDPALTAATSFKLEGALDDTSEDFRTVGHITVTISEHTEG